MDGIVSLVEYRLELDRGVVATICGSIPCLGVALATVVSSFSIYGGGIAVVLVRYQTVHH